MIHYQLACDAGHGFDGWFRDSAGFESQLKTGYVTCPECGTAAVRRALMTPGVRRKGNAAAPPPAPVPTAPPPPPKAASGLPDQVRAALARMRAEIERSCDYVGPAFATEARRIHNGEADARGIYGETTPDEAAALAEDGISVASIPWVERTDS